MAKITLHPQLPQPLRARTKLKDVQEEHALAIIVKHWKRLTEAGGILVLAGARYQYTRALWITGLASRLPMNDSVEEAIAAGPDQRPRPVTKPKTVPPGPVTT